MAKSTRSRTPHGAAASLIRFGWLWLALFALAVAAAVGGELIARLPLSAVVDVVLAATVFVMGALMLFELVQAASSLVAGAGAAAVGRLLLALTVLVLPAAPLLAFDGFASVRHLPLLGASEVYDAVIGWLEKGLNGPARILSEAVLFCLGQRSGYVSYIDQARTLLEAIYYLIGVVAALNALRLNQPVRIEPSEV